MKAGLDWYKHEPRAFLDGVQGLGPDVIGAYIVLLDLIYARGGETRRDDRHLSGILGCSMRLATSLTDKLIALEKIGFDGTVLSNSRARNEVETAAKSARDARETGAKGGRKSAENRASLNKNNELDQGTLDHTLAIERDIDKIDDAKASNARDERASFLAEVKRGFEAFWSIYPNKVGKPKASAAFEPSLKRAKSVDVILDGLRRYIETKPADRPWLNPATFLNQDRWGDQPAAVVVSMPRSTATPLNAPASDLLSQLGRGEFYHGETHGHEQPRLSGPSEIDGEATRFLP